MQRACWNAAAILMQAYRELICVVSMAHRCLTALFLFILIMTTLSIAYRLAISYRYNLVFI